MGKSKQVEKCHNCKRMRLDLQGLLEKKKKDLKEKKKEKDEKKGVKKGSDSDSESNSDSGSEGSDSYPSSESSESEDFGKDLKGANKKLKKLMTKSNLKKLGELEAKVKIAKGTDKATKRFE